MFALSGFLGLPTDWDFLKDQSLMPFDWQTIQCKNLEDWVAKFNEVVRKQQPDPSILMGYSFGGRLALHALVNKPIQWNAAVIISTHPGLSDQKERDERLKHDQQWAERFNQESWPSLMQAWNGQEVFAQDDYQFEREEKDYQRHQLVHALMAGSLGQQEDLRKQISQLNIPILWITGSWDVRYTQLAESIKFTHPLSKRVMIADAGHRLPWAQPTQFAEQIRIFLQKL